MTTPRFSGPNNRPTKAEARLIKASNVGEAADCRELPEHERRVSAKLIAALATGTFKHLDWPDWKLHPNGVLLAGARVLEQLYLENREIPTPLRFKECEFQSGITLDYARVDGALMLDDCGVAGECRLVAVRIKGQFRANGAHFENKDKDAVSAQAAQAASWFMDNAVVKGGFAIVGAQIAGQFSANGAKFKNQNGDGDAVFAQAVQAAAWFMLQAEVEGRFDINSAQLAGPFEASEALFKNPNGDAVFAQAIQAAAWFMRRAEVTGGFDVAAATIAGQFGAGGALFKNPNGTAIAASWARIDGGVFLRKDETETRVHGQCNFAGAAIGQMLDLSGAEISSRAGPALRLNTATVDGEVRLTGTHVTGAILARRAFFKGAVDLQETDLKAVPRKSEEEGDDTHGYALIFQDARIDGRLIMPETRPKGIVDLSRASCAVLEDFETGWPPPLARKAERNADRRSDDEGDMQHLVLNGFEYGYLERPDGKEKSGGEIEAARKDWLAGQAAAVLTSHLNPQPWRQAAKVLHEMGHDTAAQEVSIERRVRERQAKDAKGFERFVSWMLHALADYGFNPWKTILWCAFVVALWAAAFGAGDWMCGPEGACGGKPLFVEAGYQRLDPETVKEHYPDFNALFYSLDTFIPLLELGMEAYWSINTDTWLTQQKPFVALGDGTVIIGPHFPLGWMLYILYVLQRIAGAVLIAIAVTGFTGVLTRDAYTGDAKP